MARDVMRGQKHFNIERYKGRKRLRKTPRRRAGGAARCTATRCIRGNEERAARTEQQTRARARKAADSKGEGRGGTRRGQAPLSDSESHRDTTTGSPSRRCRDPLRVSQSQWGAPLARRGAGAAGAGGGIQAQEGPSLRVAHPLFVRWQGPPPPPSTCHCVDAQPEAEVVVVVGVMIET